MAENKKYKGSIKKRLVFIILLATSLSGLLGYGSFLYWYVGNQYERNLDLAKTIGHVLSQNLAKIILLNDVAVASDITSALESFPSLDSMILYDKSKKAVYEYSKDGKSFNADPLPDFMHRKSCKTGDILRLYINATYQGMKLGYVQLNIKVKSIVDITKENMPMLFSIYMLMIIFSYFLAYVFADMFTKPILKLVSFLESVNFTDSLRYRIKITENNEFGKLYEEANTMLDRIEENYDAQKIATAAFETQGGMFIIDKYMKIVKVNESFTTITGYMPEDVMGKTPYIFKSNAQSKEFYREIVKSLLKYGYWSGEVHNLYKDGEIHYENVTIQAVLDDNGEILYYVVSFVDLSLQKEIEAKLDYVKRYDTLTGLLNQDSVLKKLQLNLDSDRDGSWGALIRFNIKDFKLINDACGRANGDLVLIQISERLKEKFRNIKLIGRLGADDFVMCFGNIDKSKDNTSLSSKLIAKRLIKLLGDKFAISKKSINLAVYVGIALYDENSKVAIDLLKQADIALRLAKQEERQIVFFDKQAEDMAKAHVDIYTQLLTAIKEEQFELVYQLQYNKNREVYAAESLLRWNHPEKGFVSPLDFIQVAEKTGLILPIGLWVIKTACKQLALWAQNPKTAHLVLAVNISAKQFKDENFIKDVKNEIEKNGINYQNIKLELTESVLIDNIDCMIRKMQDLQDIGIKISLDDFGTGYASLEYLKNLPISQMKIDMSFVKNMLYDKRDVAIIESILLLGKALDIEVIAEGVETKAHYESLKNMGCDFYQGSYFARPEKIENINKLIGLDGY